MQSRYIVLHASEPEILAGEVSLAIGRGYAPHGPMVIHPINGSFHQPMLLVKEQTKWNSSQN